MSKYISIFRVVLKCVLVARKENLTGADRLPDLPVDPTGFHLWSVWF